MGNGPLVVREVACCCLQELMDRMPYLSATAKLAVYETRKILKR